VCFYNAEKSKVDLYDALTREYLLKEISEEGCFEIRAKSARLIVVLPSGSEVKEKDGNYNVGTTVVAYRQTRIQ
jgi:hypothetical protein